MLQDLVGFYRNLIQPIIDFVNSALSWNVPALAIDIIIVYLVLFRMSLRTLCDPLTGKRANLIKSVDLVRQKRELRAEFAEDRESDIYPGPSWWGW